MLRQKFFLIIQFYTGLGLQKHLVVRLIFVTQISDPLKFVGLLFVVSTGRKRFIFINMTLGVKISVQYYILYFWQSVKNGNVNEKHVFNFVLNVCIISSVGLVLIYIYTCIYFQTGGLLWRLNFLKIQSLIQVPKFISTFFSATIGRLFGVERAIVQDTSHIGATKGRRISVSLK